MAHKGRSIGLSLTLLCYSLNAFSSVPLTIQLSTVDILTGKKSFKSCADSSCTVTLFQGTHITRSLRITNTSSVVVKHIEAIGLPKDVKQNAQDCIKVQPKKSCNLIFTSGATRTTGKNVIIKGENTPGITITMSVLGLGDSYGGGKIACLSSDSQFQLVAANLNVPTPLTWGELGQAVGPNAQSNDNGARNTEFILKKLGRDDDYAAKQCSVYSIDSKGNSPCQTPNPCYTKWFLPAKNQLNCLWVNRAIVGGFSPNLSYWSSTESSEISPEQLAWSQSFNSIGEQLTSLKDIPLNVRCVRSIPVA